MIIAFSSFPNIPAAKIWYTQLANLGYDNHCIIALDGETYKTLSTDYRVLNATRYVPRMKLQKPGNENEISWHIRMNTLGELVKDGNNVFLSDVESIWLIKVGLSTLPRNIDVFHSTAGIVPPYGKIPKWASEQFGFAICGRMAGFRSTENTIRLLGEIGSSCEGKCDDQVVVNEVYKMVYEVVLGKFRFWCRNVVL